MFILRRITKDNVEINTHLGIDYVLMLKSKCESEFKQTTSLWGKEDLEGVYGVVTFNCGDDIMPLYSDSSYYVMTGEGNTFANITEKSEK